jgi:hypothetical protein
VPREPLQPLQQASRVSRATGQGKAQRCLAGVNPLAKRSKNRCRSLAATQMALNPPGRTDKGDAMVLVRQAADPAAAAEEVYSPQSSMEVAT